MSGAINFRKGGRRIRAVPRKRLRALTVLQDSRGDEFEIFESFQKYDCRRRYPSSAFCGTPDELALIPPSAANRPVPHSVEKPVWVNSGFSAALRVLPDSRHGASKFRYFVALVLTLSFFYESAAHEKLQNNELAINRPLKRVVSTLLPISFTVRECCAHIAQDHKVCIPHPRNYT